MLVYTYEKDKVFFARILNEDFYQRTYGHLYYLCDVTIILVVS